MIVSAMPIIAGVFVCTQATMKLEFEALVFAAIAGLVIAQDYQFAVYADDEWGKSGTCADFIGSVFAGLALTRRGVASLSYGLRAIFWPAATLSPLASLSRGFCQTLSAPRKTNAKILVGIIDRLAIASSFSYFVQTLSLPLGELADCSDCSALPSALLSQVGLALCIVCLLYTSDAADE